VSREEPDQLWRQPKLSTVVTQDRTRGSYIHSTPE
jgi:hypothetical protein